MSFPIMEAIEFLITNKIKKMDQIKYALKNRQNSGISKEKIGTLRTACLEQLAFCIEAYPLNIGIIRLHKGILASPFTHAERKNHQNTLRPCREYPYKSSFTQSLALEGFCSPKRLDLTLPMYEEILAEAGFTDIEYDEFTGELVAKFP